MTENNKYILDENSHFEEIIKSNTKKIDDLIVTDVDEWSLVNIWDIKEPLYLIEDTQHNDGIVVNLKQMQNLARTFDYIIKQHVKDTKLKRRSEQK
jgi:hypothetical protein